MTATPESAMNGVFEAAELCIERGHTHLSSRCIVDAVEAYGRACRLEELRKVEDGGCLCGAVDPEYVCVVHQRLAELEQEGG